MREIILDTETTGLDPITGHRIIEIGCVEIINRVKTGKFFHKYINPRRDVPLEAFRVHGLSTEFLKDKPFFEDVAQEFIDFIGDANLVIHNAKFDMRFLNHELALAGKEQIEFSRAIDTLLIARKKFPGSPASLDALCKRFGVSLDSRTKHGALLDSELLYEVYFELCGGSQNKMEFSYSSYQKNIYTNIENSQSIKILEKRKPQITEQELEEHKEFLKKLKNPLWESI